MNAASGSAPAAAAAGAGASSASTGTARAGPPPAPPGPCTAVTRSGAETCAAGYEYSYEARRVALRPPNMIDSTVALSRTAPAAGASPGPGGPGGSWPSRSLAIPAPPITAVVVAAAAAAAPSPPGPSRRATDTGAPSPPHGPRARSGSESSACRGAAPATSARPAADRSDIDEWAAPASGAPPGPGRPYETSARARLTLLRRPGCAPASPSPPSDPSYRSASACIFSSVVWPGPARAVYANAAEYRGRYGTTITGTSWTDAVPRTALPALSSSTSYRTECSPAEPAPGRNTSSLSPADDRTAVSAICRPPSPATATHDGAPAHECANSTGNGAGPRTTRNDSVPCRSAPNSTLGLTCTDGRSHS